MKPSSPIHVAVAKRFPSPEWATFFEVRDDAGFRARTSADAVAMNTWVSRGLCVHGVEIKVSRSDWLRELRKPEKSGPVQKFCDRWWVAIADETIVKPGELPETWGLLVLRGGALVQVREAPKLDAAPLDRGFVAMLLRCATRGLVPAAEVEGRVAAAVEARLDSHVRMARDENQRAADELKELRGKVAAFEDASGIKIADRYAFGDLNDPKKLGAAVRILVNGESRYRNDWLMQAKQLADSASEELGEAIEIMGRVRPAPQEDA